MYLNHPERVQKYPANLVSPVKKSLETVRYCRTTPNACERPLDSLLSLR